MRGEPVVALPRREAEERGDEDAQPVDADGPGPPVERVEPRLGASEPCVGLTAADAASSGPSSRSGDDRLQDEHGGKVTGLRVRVAVELRARDAVQRLELARRDLPDRRRTGRQRLRERPGEQDFTSPRARTRRSPVRRGRVAGEEDRHGLDPVDVLERVERELERLAAKQHVAGLGGLAVAIEQLSPRPQSTYCMLFEASTMSMSSSSALPVEVSGLTAIARTGIGFAGSAPAVTVGGRRSRRPAGRPRGTGSGTRHGRRSASPARSRCPSAPRPTRPAPGSGRVRRTIRAPTPMRVARRTSP